MWLVPIQSVGALNCNFFFFFSRTIKLFKFISEKMALYSYVWAVAVSVIELMELNIDNWTIFRTKHFQRNKTQLRDCWLLCFAMNTIYRFTLIIICRNFSKKKIATIFKTWRCLFIFFSTLLFFLLVDMAATKLKEKTEFSFQISVTRMSCLLMAQ